VPEARRQGWPDHFPHAVTRGSRPPGCHPWARHRPWWRAGDQPTRDDVRPTTRKVADCGEGETVRGHGSQGRTGSSPSGLGSSQDASCLQRSPARLADGLGSAESPSTGIVDSPLRRRPESCRSHRRRDRASSRAPERAPGSGPRLGPPLPALFRGRHSAWISKRTLIIREAGGKAKAGASGGAACSCRRLTHALAARLGKNLSRTYEARKSPAAVTSSSGSGSGWSGP
jgi:hypothetical protein